MDKKDFFSNARDDLRGPLDGLRVVEATTTWAGPMAGCLLADFGATVIKVEHPEGEVTRVLPPFLPDSELTLLHETVNRNKHNVTIELRKPEGRDLFLKLCETADIVLENFKPGTLSDWGVGYSDVVKVKPDIIYASVSGYGQFGPNSERACYDPIAQAFTGWLSVNGEPDGGPIKAPTFLGDDLAGMNAAMGILAALHHRTATGEGQHIDVALVDGIWFSSNGNLTAGALDMPIPRLANQFAIAAPVNVYECSDGQIYGGVLLDAHWVALCDLIGCGEVSHCLAPERIQRRDELNKIVADWCSKRTTDEAVDSMVAIGLTVARVNSFSDAARHSNAKERDMLQMTELSDGATVPLTGPAAKFSRTPTKVNNSAPTLGQDNSDIFTALGLTETHIQELKKIGAI
jgi:crotonobetainyl-CoA:carnitine CoA-transferase CaiB-like acyl-CoA transferase